MQRWRNVRGSQEAQASGREWMLGIPKGIVGMDSLNKHVEHISFRQCITFCEHRQLKGWQPRFQTAVAKISISTIVHFLVAGWPGLDKGTLFLVPHVWKSHTHHSLSLQEISSLQASSGK